MTTFASLGLVESLVTATSSLGYEEPTPVQREAIPVLLEGRDMLGQAATGTGKTAAFALPMLQRILESGARGKTSGLVLVPTRELAMQVAEAIHKYAKGSGLSVVPVYGGAPMGLQIKQLRRGADIVVGTPGRILDHLERKTFVLDAVKVLALDEADEMLDMGFAEDLEAILGKTPKEKQTALFSATLPPRIAAIAARHLRNPARITIAREKATAGALPRVRQVAYIVPRVHKPQTLGRILDIESPSAALVFCRTRLEVDELVETLSAHGYRAEALHGGMAQPQRDRVMGLFRAKKVDLLVATDVAARGLDIDHLSHVVNYDVPSSPEVYVHRIGRTGRIGRNGVAITIAEPREHRLLGNIERLTKQRIEIAGVPTIADLRTRRLDIVRASIRERLLAGNLDDVRTAVESLAEEFDMVQVASAAVKLVLEAEGGAKDEKDIPAITLKDRGPDTDRPKKGGKAGKYAKDRRADEAGSEKPYAKKAYEKKPFVKKPYASKASDEPSDEKRAYVPVGPMTRLFVAAGRVAGVRPADLVGAITGEAGVQNKVIGSIQIHDRFSIVEVPQALATKIIDALRATKIRGRKVLVNRDRGQKES